MYKVIITDNLNRDYQPQGLVSMAMSKNNAQLIANVFNQRSSSKFFKVVPANQELNLESHYDLVGETMPYEAWLSCTGALALPEHVAKYWYETTVLNVNKDEQEWQ